jgi:hypothetical protein
MKKARAKQTLYRPDKKHKDPDRPSREVGVNDVVDNLFDLFAHLGIVIDRPVVDFADTDAIEKSFHPLYPHASAIGELLTSWHQDPNYIDELGNPRAIKLRGRSPSFQSLAQHAVPKLDFVYLLRELERLGAISVDLRNLIHVHMRSFPAYEDKRLAIQHTLSSLNGFIHTLRHNLDSSPSNSEQYFHRIARRGDFDSREIPALKIRVKRYGQTFLESFDNWLIRNSIPKVRKSGRGAAPAHVSIGVYLSVENSLRKRESR